jgi:hypothetical protein
VSTNAFDEAFSSAIDNLAHDVQAQYARIASYTFDTLPADTMALEVSDIDYYRTRCTALLTRIDTALCITRRERVEYLERARVVHSRIATTESRLNKMRIRRAYSAS